MLNRKQAVFPSVMGRRICRDRIFKPENTAFIYDYSSFTSSLHEIRNFTKRLADFYRAVRVKVFDTRMGIQTLSLGDIIDEYNTECNISPEFDASEIFQVEELILNHNTGMLGVPGNISSCTLLHGIHLAVIVRSLQACKVVGDDAIGDFLEDSYRNMSRIGLFHALENLGMLAIAKMEFWIPQEDPEDGLSLGWHYVKRPITRIGDRMHFGHMLNFPSLPNALLFKDDFHVPINPSLHQRTKTHAGQCFSFHRALSTIPSTKESSVNLAFDLMKHMHKALGITMGGHSEELPNYLIPPAYHTLDWALETIERKENVIVDLPCEGTPDVFCGERDFVGEVWSSPFLTLFRKLGFIEMKMKKRMVLPNLEPDYVKRFLDKELKPLYHVHVLKRIPDYLFDILPDSFPHVPRRPFSVEDSLMDDVDEYSSDSESYIL